MRSHVASLLCSFTHAQALHVFRRAQSRSPTRPLSGDFAVFFVVARKRISFFTDMRMLFALGSPILLLGRADAARPRVHRGGRNWLHPQTRYWSPVERTLNLFLNFFLREKIQTQETGRTFVPVPFFVFLRGRFCKFFWFNRTSKIGAVEGVRKLLLFIINRESES